MKHTETYVADNFLRDLDEAVRQMNDLKNNADGWKRFLKLQLIKEILITGRQQ